MIKIGNVKDKVEEHFKTNKWLKRENYEMMKEEGDKSGKKTGTLDEKGRGDKGKVIKD